MGRGGHRWNAGRPGWHVKAEHCLRLDVRRWHRDGFLRPGASGTWRWTDSYSGEERGIIGYRVREEHVHLDYSVDGVPSGQTVALARTRCNYGGTRPWFICPVRGERVAVLFMRAGRFACRHCQRIAYASQSDDMIGRTWRKQRKTEAKLGENWQRPKGMHRATRERLLSIILDCEERRDVAIAGHLSTLLGRHPSLAGELRF